MERGRGVATAEKARPEVAELTGTRPTPQPYPQMSSAPDGVPKRWGMTLAASRKVELDLGTRAGIWHAAYADTIGSGRAARGISTHPSSPSVRITSFLVEDNRDRPRRNGARGPRRSAAQVPGRMAKRGRFRRCGVTARGGIWRSVAVNRIAASMMWLWRFRGGERGK